MLTPGAFFNISSALLPCVDTASETFITILSSFCSITGTFAVTTADLRATASGARAKIPKSKELLFSSIFTVNVVSLNPMNDTLTLHSPALRLFILNVPSSDDVVPPITFSVKS